MSEERPRIVAADAIIRRLVDAGVVPANCRRVVIDLAAGVPATLYFEVLGDTRLEIALAAGIEMRKPDGK